MISQEKYDKWVKQQFCKLCHKYHFDSLRSWEVIIKYVLKRRKRGKAKFDVWTAIHVTKFTPRQCELVQDKPTDTFFLFLFFINFLFDFWFTSSHFKTSEFFFSFKIFDLKLIKYFSENKIWGKGGKIIEKVITRLI